MAASDSPSHASPDSQMTTSALRDESGVKPRLGEEEAQPSGPGAPTGHERQTKRRFSSVSPRIARASAWVLTLVVGSLLVPAVTKQWTDRPNELELKNSLVKEISKTSTDAIVINRVLLAGATPERRVANDTYQQWRNAPVDKREAAWQKYQEAFIGAGKAETEALNESFVSLQRDTSIIKAQLQVYFPQTGLAADWSRYADALSGYIGLTTARCGAARFETVANLQSYIGNKRVINWHALRHPSRDRNCRSRHLPETMTALYVLGSDLLSRQDTILAAIIKADTVGYSNGWKDLFRDLL